MMKMKRKFALLFLVFFSISWISKAIALDPNNKLRMDLKYGPVVIEMLPKIAPLHVKRIKELVRQKFYDGLVFHRVIDGFMAQGGDPEGSGRGGSGKNIPAEFSGEPHVRGVVSMARSSDPDSGDSQFFIVFKPAPWLDGKYSVWGRVVKGMENVDQLKKGDTSNGGKVTNPDKIIRMRIVSDITQ